MTRYLLDTNHLSEYLKGATDVFTRVQAALEKGDRVGVCAPVLCEYRAGIRIGRHYRRNAMLLNAALDVLRVWPVDVDTTQHFAELSADLRKRGRVLSQFDLLIAAVARQHKLVLLTADADFDALKGVRVRNWISSSAAGT